MSATASSSSKRPEPPSHTATDPREPLKKRRAGPSGGSRACQECRRLKLRCDRSIPCSSCVKRGCGAICPDGSLITGQGNRFVLSSTAELHQHVSDLSARVRQLEDALRDSHAKSSSEEHPLLSEDLLKMKTPLQREPPPFQRSGQFEPNDDESGPEMLEAFGSLSIDATGKSKFFGHGATSSYFLRNEEDAVEPPSKSRVHLLQGLLPPELLSASYSLPMPALNREHTLFRTIHAYLPSAERARRLRDIYFERGSFMYDPISTTTFDELFQSFYKSDTSPDSIGHIPGQNHTIAVLFMVFAIGCLMDPALHAYNLDAEKYYQLARVALFQAGIVSRSGGSAICDNNLFDEPSLSAVQALHLMVYYLFLSSAHTDGTGMRWCLMGLTIKMAQSIGLHRDAARWNLDEAETARRRQLFWELYTYDTWQCMTYSRPAMFSLQHIDCKMPYPSDISDENSFHAWKHRFASDCMSVVNEKAFMARTSSYATVLQLDRRIRAFPVPAILQIPGFGNLESSSGSFPETTKLILQRHVVLAIREMNLLYLHRSFFGRAINDHPEDPLGSPFGTSVLAAYRSSGSYIALLRNLHSHLKEISERLWFLWSHLLSCAIVLGSIVTRCPGMSLAPSALTQLDSACNLFAKTATMFNAQSVLQLVLKIQAKAHASLKSFKEGKSPGSSQTFAVDSPTAEADDADELAILGGRTRLIPPRREQSESPQNASAHVTPEQYKKPILPLPLAAAGQQPPQMHPNVIEYLRTFQPTPSPAGSGGSSLPNAPRAIRMMRSGSTTTATISSASPSTSSMSHSSSASPLPQPGFLSAHPSRSPPTRGSSHIRYDHDQIMGYSDPQQMYHQRSGSYSSLSNALNPSPLAPTLPIPAATPPLHQSHPLDQQIMDFAWGSGTGTTTMTEDRSYRFNPSPSPSTITATAAAAAAATTSQENVNMTDTTVPVDANTLPDYFPVYDYSFPGGSEYLFENQLMLETPYSTVNDRNTPSGSSQEGNYNYSPDGGWQDFFSGFSSSVPSR